MEMRGVQGYTCTRLEIGVALSNCCAFKIGFSLNQDLKASLILWAQSYFILMVWTFFPMNNFFREIFERKPIIAVSLILSLNVKIRLITFFPPLIPYAMNQTQ